MEKIIWNGNEESFRKSVPEKLSSHPSFKRVIFEIQQFIANGFYPNIYISENGNNLIVCPDMKIKMEDSIPNSNLKFLDVNLNEMNELSLESIYGFLYDGRLFYHNQLNKPYYNVDAVMTGCYNYFLYDGDGIEMFTSSYYIDHVNLFGTLFNDEKLFRENLLSKGWHRPLEWTIFNGPVLPNYAFIDNPHTTSIKRVNTALAEVRVCDYYNGYCAKPSLALAYIHSEFPERLRVDTYNIYGVANNNEIVKPNWYQNDPRDFKKIETDIMEQYGQMLNDSKTFEYDKKTYEVLKERYEKDLEMYRMNNSQYYDNAKKSI